MTTIAPESISAQVDKIKRMASDTKFPFVCFVTEIDGTHKNEFNNVPYETFYQISLTVAEKYPNASYMLIASGPTNCAVFVHVGAESSPSFGRDWLQACSFGVETTNFDIDGAENITDRLFVSVPFPNPMKDKEQIGGQAFAWLRKNHMMEEEEEESVPYDLDNL